MTEYIMQVDYDMLNGTFTHKKREEIVRCRDCAYCMAYMAGTYCDYMAHAVTPDGFCAWGERRKA